jgi:hypothetical protein
MQAAEVVHEDNLNVIASLPEIYSNTETFCFPYVTVIGNYKIADEARLRFCQNLPWLEATGDAWALSVTKKFVRSEARRNLKSPKNFLNLIGRGVEWRFASCMNNERSRMIYLPKEIIRYPALFKANYIERCKGHRDYFNLPEFHRFIDELGRMGDEDFVQRAVEMNLNRYPKYNAHYTGDFAALKPEDHPKIMHELLSSTQKSYMVRDSILEKIANS